MTRDICDHARAYIASTGTLARANFYRYEDQGWSQALVRADRNGTNARQSFDKRRGDTEEAAVVERVERREYTLCNNVNDPKEQEKWGLIPDRGRDYDAFVTVPVATENKIFGMLSVNVNGSGLLTTAHVNFLQTLAWLVIEAQLLNEKVVPDPASAGGA